MFSDRYQSKAGSSVHLGYSGGHKRTLAPVSFGQPQSTELHSIFSEFRASVATKKQLSSYENTNFELHSFHNHSATPGFLPTGSKNTRNSHSIFDG